MHVHNEEGITLTMPQDVPHSTGRDVAARMNTNGLMVSSKDNNATTWQLANRSDLIDTHQ